MTVTDLQLNTDASQAVGPFLMIAVHANLYLM